MAVGTSKSDGEPERTIEPRLAPAAGPLCQAFASTMPLAMVIVWFLWEAHQLPTNVCDEQIEEEVCANVRLVDMTIVCLIMAQLWACLAVYLSFFVPKRHEVILEYLEDGRTLIGDVFYREETKCGRLSTTHFGHVTYPHPCSEVRMPPWKSDRQDLLPFTHIVIVSSLRYILFTCERRCMYCNDTRANGWRSSCFPIFPSLDSRRQILRMIWLRSRGTRRRLCGWPHSLGCG